MLAVRLVRPSPDLAGVGRHHQIADARLAPGGLRLPKPARADQFLEFPRESPMAPDRAVRTWPMHCLEDRECTR